MALLALVVVSCGYFDGRVTARSTGPFTPPPVLPAPSPSPASTVLQQVTVTQVIDGDSIEVHFADGRNVRVRLIGLDAPDSGQPYRGHANRFTAEQLPVGRAVFLETDAQLWDRQNRYLAYVWLAEPGRDRQSEAKAKMLNAVLLLQGYARTQGSGPNARYEAAFQGYEASAKQARRGIWGL